MQNKTLASVVKEAREKIGISQRELSRRTGIDNNTVAKIEKGERKKPNILSLRKLSYILKLDLGEILKLAEYNKNDIDIALNQNDNSFTIIHDDSSIVLLEDILKSNEEKLLAKKIMKELMEDVNYEEINFLNQLNGKDKKVAIRSFKNFKKENDDDIENLSRLIQRTNEVINKKND
ncbi:MAG: helix-turn-helix transcriptional regulator [Bacilli bacterium]